MLMAEDAGIPAIAMLCQRVATSGEPPVTECFSQYASIALR